MSNRINAVRVRAGFAATVALIIGFAVATQAAAKGPDIDKVNGAIGIEAGQEAGNLETVNGAIRVAEDAIVASVGTVNGGVHIGDRSRAAGVETVNGGITVGDGVAIGSGGLSTVNGGIRIGESSVIDGGVETVNGAISVHAAQIAGDVETTKGDILIDGQSRVGGGIKVHKSVGSWLGWFGQSKAPRIVIGQGVEVAGPLTFERDVELHIHDTATTGPITGATAQRFSGATP